MIITERGLGKTYGFLIKRLRQFVFKGKKTLILAKYKYEVVNKRDETLQYSIEQTIREIIRDRADRVVDRIKKVEYNGRHILINDKIAFSFYTLNEGEDIKKLTYLKEYDLIWHDEAIRKKGHVTDEVTLLLMIYDTVARRRGVDNPMTSNDAPKLVLTANSITMYNPYFNGFNLNVSRRGYTFIKERRWLVHISDNKAYQKQREHSPISMLAGEKNDYIKMASSNEFAYDKNEFVVETLEDFEKHYFGLLIAGKEVCVSKVRNGLYLHQKRKGQQLFHNKIPSRDSTPLGKNTLDNLKKFYNFSRIYYQNIEIKRNFEKEYMGVINNE